MCRKHIYLWRTVLLQARHISSTTSNSLWLRQHNGNTSHRFRHPSRHTLVLVMCRTNGRSQRAALCHSRLVQTEFAHGQRLRQRPAHTSRCGRHSSRHALFLGLRRTDGRSQRAVVCQSWPIQAEIANWRRLRQHTVHLPHSVRHHPRHHLFRYMSRTNCKSQRKHLCSAGMV